MAATRFYGTSTTYAVGHGTFTQELQLATSAPGSGSTSEEIRKNSTEAAFMWTGPAAGVGWTIYVTDTAEQSLDLSAFPSGLALTTGQDPEDAQTVIVSSGGVADVDSVQMGSWSSTTGTGIKTRSYSSGAFDSGSFATSDEVSFGASILNTDAKNNLTATVDYSSGDTWVEVEEVTPTSTSVARIGLASGTDPARDDYHSIKLRARTTTGTTGVLKAALYESTNNRSGDLSTPALTTTLTDYTLPISSSSIANITSYADLEIRLWGEDAYGNALTFEVDYVALSLPASDSEDYSGTTSASNTSAIVLTASRTSSGATSASSASATTVDGSRSSSGAATQVSSTSSASAQGDAGRAGAATASNISAVTVTGAKGAESYSGTASASHASGAVVAGSKAASGTTSSTHASAAVSTGVTNRSDAVTESNTTAVSSSGIHAGEATLTDSFTSAVTATGTAAEARSGTAATSHTSATTATGDRAEDRSGVTSTAHSASIVLQTVAARDRSASVSISSTSATTGAGTTGRQDAATVTHTVGETVAGSRAEAHSGLASTSATSATSATGDALEVRSGTTAASHTVAVTSLRSTGRQGAITVSYSAATSGSGDKTGTGAAVASHVSSSSNAATKHRDNQITQNYTALANVTGNKTFESMYLRPVGDGVITGWTVEPLWSKVDEDTPDGTVISASS